MKKNFFEFISWFRKNFWMIAVVIVTFGSLWTALHFDPKLFTKSVKAPTNPLTEFLGAISMVGLCYLFYVVVKYNPKKQN